MAKTLSSITLNEPAAPVSASTSDTFTFTGTPGFSGSGGVNRYDFRWEVDDGGGYVPIASSGSGLTTADTNPLVNSNSQSANSITVTCTDAGSYTIRIVGAPTTGGAYTVTSASQTVTVSAPAGITSDATWAQAAGGWAAQAKQALDATAAFTQAAGGWAGEATQRLDAVASVIQAPASWAAVTAAPIASQATFAQAAAGWDASVDVASSAITSDATWAQPAAGWAATVGTRLDAPATFAQAAGAWAADAALHTDAAAAFTQGAAAWAATAAAPIAVTAGWAQVNGWAAEVYAGEPSPLPEVAVLRRHAGAMGPPEGAMRVVRAYRTGIRLPTIVDDDEEDPRGNRREG